MPFPQLKKSHRLWKPIKMCYRKRHCQIRDLGGRKPQGHPALRRGPAGKALVALKQVWVEGHSQELWRIIGLKRARDTIYPHDVMVRRYRGKEVRIFAETTLRLNMQVWDDWGPAMEELMDKLYHMSAHDPESPFKKDPQPGASGRAFFGLDENGYRKD